LPIYETIRAEPVIALGAFVTTGNPGLPFKGNPCLFQFVKEHP